MKWYHIKALILGASIALTLIFNPAAIADGTNSGPGSGYGGDGGTNEIVCKLKALGIGYILVGETQSCFHFHFKAEDKYGELKGFLRAVDQASGVCITSTKVLAIEQIDDKSLSIDYEVNFHNAQTGTVNIVVRDSGSSEECDAIEVTREEGVSISGTVGHGCGCDWGHIKVDVKCHERCKGGVLCKGHPVCEEHPFCKGKKCKGHKDCGDHDDDGEGDDGEGDGDHPCMGHPECKPKCKGGKLCKGHPYCDEHPVCEVPNCKGHKKCKDAKCKGHPECRKNYKHKNGCKAKKNPKQPCTCKKIKKK